MQTLGIELVFILVHPYNHDSNPEVVFPSLVEAGSSFRALHKPRVVLKLLCGLGVDIHSLEESGTRG